MELHKVLSVSATEDDGSYIVSVDITDIAGERYICDYAVTPTDNFGLAPAIRDAVEQWISDDKPVAPYMPPSPEEARSAMPPLTARQFRLALIGGGISAAQVEAAIAAIEDEQARAVAQVEWEYATQILRTHPLVEQLAPVLGLTPEQVDTMWEGALDL